MPPNKPLPTSSDTLPDQSVTTDKLVDLAVTSAKQALTGSFIDYVDVGGRALNVIYQNTSGKLKLVVYSVECFCQLITDSAIVISRVQNITPPAIDRHSLGLNAPGGAGEVLNLIGFLLVPDGFYYELVTQIAGTGTVSLDGWIEYEL